MEKTKTTVRVKCPAKRCGYEGLYEVTEEIPKARWCTVCGAGLENEEQVPESSVKKE